MDKFTRWTILQIFPTTHSHDKYALCKCACGTIRRVKLMNVRNGKSKSCGCFRHVATRIHGMAIEGHITPTYHSWDAMIQRCHNPKSKFYSYYGGRGIRVCECWRTSFLKFLEDMGERPVGNYTLERTNNSLGYFKDNCIWSTRAQQMRNTRRTVLITAFGKTQCRKDWAIELNISSPCIKYRMESLGLKAEEALTSDYLPTCKSCRGR